ncbi:MAG: trigger factor [bacterium]|nr:trigger factor [bacterium]MCM1423690.1 trigger factor [bacterium]
MKKRICVIAAVLSTSLFLTACGSKEYLKDIKAEKYVTLGEYKGITATADKPEVPDSLIENYITENFLAPKAEKVPVTGRAVQTGDVANIDFTGYLDGTAFDGGAGTDFDLTIGSGQFIDGFEEGLIGANVGDQVSLDLTFPDPYTNADLAGKAVVFEVTVNSISENKVPELTDELVKELRDDGYNVGESQTADELKASVRDLYERAVQTNYDSAIEMELASQIMENSTFQEPPAEMVERFRGSIENNVSVRAASLNMTLAQYMQLYEGLDEEGYRALFDEESVQMAKQYIMYQAIADREGLAPAQEQISEKISSLMTLYGYASEEELKKSVDVEAVEEDLMRENVVAFLKENGKVSPR